MQSEALHAGDAGGHALPRDTDVLVIGAGVSGLACALALLQDGRGVTVIDAGRIGGGASHGNCGTITPSHAPPLAAPGTIARALKWMFTPDAPLYIPARFDPALWRWLGGFARRCNHHDWLQSARAKSALLNDSRARLADWIATHGLDCEFSESGEDYVFHTQSAMDKELRELPMLREFGIASEVIDGPAFEAQEPALKPGVAGAIRFSGDAALRPDKYVAELARAVRERWFGWRPMSRDDIPLIGRAPGHRHLWLATGHGMMGVGMSAGTGQLLADLVAGRAPAVDPAAFDPARFA